MTSAPTPGDGSEERSRGTDPSLRISIASDHRGVRTKRRLVQSLEQNGYSVSDHGTHTDDSCDYPDYACSVASDVSNGRADRGILICGSGIGMSIVANKFVGVRAASCYDEVLVEISRQHNDVNVLCLPGDLIGSRPVDAIVLKWLTTSFEGGRHGVRIDKIARLEADGLATRDGSSERSDNEPSETI